MKLIKNFLLAIGVVLLSGLLFSCSSDPDSIEFLNKEGNIRKSVVKTYLQLGFDVAGTRAVSASEAALAEESKITKVNIYIFDADDVLETSKTGISVVDGKQPVIIETSAGKKTIYAVTAKELFTPSEGMTLTQFVDQAFDSKLADIKTTDGFVMVGSIVAESLKESKTPANIPADNKFTIKLTRLAAKVKVAWQNDFALGNLSFSNDIYFKVFQTNNSMSIAGLKSQSEVNSNHTGTYGNYTFGDGTEYTAKAISFLSSQTVTFSDDGCLYLPENIVETPTTGNTTFVSVRLCYYPKGHNVETTFYTIAIIDSTEENKILDTYNEDGSIYYSTSKSSADNKLYDLESDNPLPKEYKYKVLEYTKGYTFYRINIKDVVDEKGENYKYQVLRNKYYKILINSITGLGAPSEEYLCPQDPASGLEDSNISYKVWASSQFDVKPWGESNQTEDL